MNWAHRMTDSLSYAAPATTGTGDMTFGTVTTIKGYVSQRRALGGDAGDRAQLAITFVSETSIALRSRVWLPGVTTSDVSKALSVIGKDQQTILDGSYIFYTYDLE